MNAAQPVPVPASFEGLAYTNGSPSTRLLTAVELAERWQLPTSWIYARTRSGVIPTVRLGRYYRYRLAAIEAFEAAGGVAADA